MPSHASPSAVWGPKRSLCHPVRSAALPNQVRNASTFQSWSVPAATGRLCIESESPRSTSSVQLSKLQNLIPTSSTCLKHVGYLFCSHFNVPKMDNKDLDEPCSLFPSIVTQRNANLTHG